MIAIILILLVFPAWALAAPSISGTSGTMSHGSSITISGSAFGSKGGTNANKPLIWADFETDINPTSLGHLTSWDGNENLVRNVGGTQYTNSGANVVGTRSSGVRAFSFHIEHTFSSKMYLSGKRRFSSVSSNNLKIFRMWNDVPSSFLVANVSAGVCYDESFTSAPNRFQPITLSANVWRTEEYRWQKSTSNGGVTGNGVWEFRLNGAQEQFLDDLASTLSANYGQYLGLQIIDTFDTNDDLANGTTIHFDDFYVDDTWARVMIGNASTLSASTVLEVQIPSAWSDTSITVQVNRGSFGSTDSAYLFVVDANNVVSAGQAITFGDTGGGSTVESGSMEF